MEHALKVCGEDHVGGKRRSFQAFSASDIKEAEADVASARPPESPRPAKIVSFIPDPNTRARWSSLPMRH